MASLIYNPTANFLHFLFTLPYLLIESVRIKGRLQFIDQFSLEKFFSF